MREEGTRQTAFSIQSLRVRAQGALGTRLQSGLTLAEGDSRCQAGADWELGL